LLSPVGPTPAPKLETSKYWNYTSYWNLANYPAGVFPTRLFVGEETVKKLSMRVEEQEYTARNKHEQWIVDTYSAEYSKGVSSHVAITVACCEKLEVADRTGTSGFAGHRIHRT
jgi:hypothetical protein